MTLWLVRHARPVVDEGVCYGATDLQADPQETLQAAAALAAVLPEGIAVLSSPLQRCVQLAQALGLPYRTDARLAEMDFGCWEGTRWTDIGQDDYRRWTEDFAGYRFGGKESVSQLMARVGAAFEEARQAGDDVLWVTHAGVIRAARLFSQGGGVPRDAAGWPKDGLAFGAGQCIQL
jgi:alpha-ribazole phosphatase